MSKVRACELGLSRGVATALVLAMTFVLSACGGGGSSDMSGSGASGVNGKLSGTLYYDSAIAYVGFDLLSGDSATIYSQTGAGTNPAYNASEFANVQIPNSAFRDVVIFHPDGSEHQVVVSAPFNFGGPVKLSRDQSMVLVSSTGGGNEGTLSVYSRNGDLVGSFDGVNTYDWTPDGHVAFVASEGLYYVLPNSNDPGAPIRQFVGRAPADLIVSPDGQHIAMSLDDGSQVGTGSRHVWVMDADGSHGHQLTHSSQGETQPAWSPDGKTLVVIKSVYTCPPLWAVPVDAEMATLDEASPAPAQEIVQPVGTGTSTVCGYSAPQWRS